MDRRQLADGAVGVYETYPGPTKNNLLRLRELIHEVGEGLPEVGAIQETLRWGQPGFITESGSGSTIRIDATKAGQPGDFAMYFTCSTSLVDQFRQMFGETFVYEGGRALVFENEGILPEEELRECISMALTYHLRKND